MKCSLCGSDDEVRPYGPIGSMICFDCAFATPEASGYVFRFFNLAIAESVKNTGQQYLAKLITVL